MVDPRDREPDPSLIASIESFRGANCDTLTLFYDREGPFTNFELMSDECVEGKRWITLMHRTVNANASGLPARPPEARVFQS